MLVMTSRSGLRAAWPTSAAPQMLATAGRIFYGVAMLAFGALHIFFGDFVTRIVPWWPAAIPGRPLWAYTVGILLGAAGVALLADRRTAMVSMLLAWSLLASFVCLGLPLAAGGPVLGGGWTVAGKALALCGGAVLLALGSHETDGRSIGSLQGDAGLERFGWAVGRWFFSVFLVLCGIQHFIHVDFVASLVPGWIPPGRIFWTFAAGVLLIAGGVGLLLPVTIRFAGRLTGVMIFSWVFLVHVPRAAATFPRTAGEITAVFEALAMTGIAWLIAAQAERRDQVLPAGHQQHASFARR